MPKMNKNFLLTLIAFGLTAVSSSATVTLQFSTASNKLTEIQNAAGNAAGGLKYGIIVDTGGTGFSDLGLNYDGFTLPAANSKVRLARGVDGALTDDYFYWEGETTVPSVTGTDGGNNAITTNFIVNTDGIIQGGAAFALVWFDTNTADGDKYGFLSIPGGANPFTLPAEGNTVSYSPNFAGADTPRLASNTLGAVPEPSRTLFVGFGLLGFILRRRRA